MNVIFVKFLRYSSFINLTNRGKLKMKKFAIAEVQKIHNAVFGCNATDRDILKYLKEAEETLMLCKQQSTLENIKELLVFWFNEEKKKLKPNGVNTLA